MSDAGRRVESHPVDEVSVLPQGRVLPNRIKVATERGLCVRVLGLSNRLRDVAGLAEFRGAQCPEEDLECLMRWETRRSVESDGRPFIRTAVLHDESEHLRKIGLIV